MAYQLCRHIRTNGRRCKAASLNQNIYCFFHQHLHHTDATSGYLPGQHIEHTALEHRESVSRSDASAA